jgi:hypothetical protein
LHTKPSQTYAVAFPSITERSFSNAGASFCDVRIEKIPNLIPIPDSLYRHNQYEGPVIVVKDDGIGFNMEEVIDNSRCNNKKYGILGIYERLNELGGTITVESKINNGTEYKIKLPRIRRRDCFDKISNS